MASEHVNKTSTIIEAPKSKENIDIKSMKHSETPLNKTMQLNLRSTIRTKPSPMKQLNRLPSTTTNKRDVKRPMFNNKRMSDIDIISKPEAPKTKIVRKRKIYTTSPIKRPEPRSGVYLKPKRLILSDYKVLVPSGKAAPTVPVYNLHDNLPENDSREHLDEVEIPDIDLTNYHTSSLIGQNLIPANSNYGFNLQFEAEKPKFTIMDVKRMIHEIPDDIDMLEKYIDNADLDQKPTNVLVKLAEKLHKQNKRRRRELYKDLKNPESSSSSDDEESEHDDYNNNNRKYKRYNYRKK